MNSNNSQIESLLMRLQRNVISYDNLWDMLNAEDDIHSIEDILYILKLLDITNNSIHRGVLLEEMSESDIFKKVIHENYNNKYSELLKQIHSEEVRNLFEKDISFMESDRLSERSDDSEDSINLQNNPHSGYTEEYKDENSFYEDSDNNQDTDEENSDIEFVPSKVGDIINPYAEFINKQTSDLFDDGEFEEEDEEEPTEEGEDTSDDDSDEDPFDEDPFDDDSFDEDEPFDEYDEETLEEEPQEEYTETSVFDDYEDEDDSDEEYYDSSEEEEPQEDTPLFDDDELDYEDDDLDYEDDELDYEDNEEEGIDESDYSDDTHVFDNDDLDYEDNDEEGVESEELEKEDDVPLFDDESDYLDEEDEEDGIAEQVLENKTPIRKTRPVMKKPVRRKPNKGYIPSWGTQSGVTSLPKNKPVEDKEIKNPVIEKNKDSMDFITDKLSKKLSRINLRRK